MGYDSYEDLMYEYDYGGGDSGSLETALPNSGGSGEDYSGTDDSGAQTGGLFTTYTAPGERNAPTGGIWNSDTSWTNTGSGSDYSGYKSNYISRANSSDFWNSNYGKIGGNSSGSSIGGGGGGGGRVNSGGEGGGGGYSGTRLPATTQSYGSAPSYQQKSYGSAPSYQQKSYGYVPALNLPTLNTNFGALPTYTAPTYTAPKYDKKQAYKYAQEYALPYIAEYRRAIAKALQSSGASGNPVLQRFAIEGAADAFSEGLGKSMATAGKEGRSQYNEEYGRLLDAAKTGYSAAVDAAKMNYTTALNAYNAKRQDAILQYEKKFQAAMAQWNANKLAYS